MARTTDTGRPTAPGTTATRRPPSLRRLQAAAAIRICFGLIWAVDASFKWLPGFIHGRTINDELGLGSSVHLPVLHQWIAFWHSVGTSAPGAFAVGAAVVESCIAFGLLFGVLSNAVFIGSAVYSFGLWSAAQAFGMPWTTPGITDVGPSAGYVIASLALLHAHAGAVWSLDPRIRRHLGRLAPLASPGPDQVPGRASQITVPSGSSS